jgi:hypothetical protein
LPLIQKSAGFVSDESIETPIPHWIYMGLNEKSSGKWNQEDVDYTAEPATMSERSIHDIDGIKKRMRHMGVIGYLRLFYQKVGILWGDGTFGSDSSQGRFIHSPKIYQRLQPLLTKVKYTWANAVSLLMIMSLLISIAKKRTALSEMFVFGALSIVGITLFHGLFWEVYYRYVLLIVGIFILLSVETLPIVFERINRKFIVGCIVLIPLLFVGGIWQMRQDKTSAQGTVVTTQIAKRTLSKNQVLVPNEGLSQKIVLNNNANRFEFVLAPTKTVKVSLINKGKLLEEKVLKEGGYRAILEGRYKPGVYQIRIQSTSHEATYVMGQKNSSVQLAPYSISPGSKNSSLNYQVLTKPVAYSYTKMQQRFFEIFVLMLELLLVFYLFKTRKNIV